MKSPSKQLCQFLFMVMFLSALPFIALYVYDPLQVFHRHYHVEGKIYGNMRLQAAGLVNNYEFDSIIIGTSMLKASSAELASELFGGKFVNLSADGSTIFERSLILNYALRKKKISRVFFSFDTGLDIHSKISPAKYPLENFSQLYDLNPFNDAGVYWNKHHLECLTSFSKSSKCVGGSRSLQREKTWFKSIYAINEEISGVDNWVGPHPKARGRAISSRLRRHVRREHSKDAALIRENAWKLVVNQNFIPLVDEYSDVDFDVIFPPYSRFLTSTWKIHNPLKYADYKKVIRRLVSLSMTRENLNVYAFGDLAYVDNLENYRDMRHYNVDMNEAMFKSIAKKKNLLDFSSLEEYLKFIDKKNNDYDNAKYLNQIFDVY